MFEHNQNYNSEKTDKEKENTKELNISGVSQKEPIKLNPSHRSNRSSFHELNPNIFSNSNKDPKELRNPNANSSTGNFNTFISTNSNNVNSFNNINFNNINNINSLNFNFNFNNKNMSQINSFNSNPNNYLKHDLNISNSQSSLNSSFKDSKMEYCSSFLTQSLTTIPQYGILSNNNLNKNNNNNSFKDINRKKSTGSNTFIPPSLYFSESGQTNIQTPFTNFNMQSHIKSGIDDMNNSNFSNFNISILKKDLNKKKTLKNFNNNCNFQQFMTNITPLVQRNCYTVFDFFNLFNSISSYGIECTFKIPLDKNEHDFDMKKFLSYNDLMNRDRTFYNRFKDDKTSNKMVYFPTISAFHVEVKKENTKIEEKYEKENSILKDTSQPYDIKSNLSRLSQGSFESLISLEDIPKNVYNKKSYENTNVFSFYEENTFFNRPCLKIKLEELFKTHRDLKESLLENVTERSWFSLLWTPKATGYGANDVSFLVFYKLKIKNSLSALEIIGVLANRIDETNQLFWFGKIFIKPTQMQQMFMISKFKTNS